MVLSRTSALASESVLPLLYGRYPLPFDRHLVERTDGPQVISDP
jgi:hypothetical protein